MHKNATLFIVFILFLSLSSAVHAALPGDLNNDGKVSISEVQTTINAFLGLVADNPNLNKATAFKTSVIPTGDGACSNGGILISSGIDKNGNGVLDSDEVESSGKVCNGLAGAPATLGDKWVLRTVVGTMTSDMGTVILQPLQYTYDPLGRKTSCGKSSNTYDDWQNISDCDGFSSFFVQEYDANNSPISVYGNDTGGTHEYKFSYQYDTNNRISTKTLAMDYFGYVDTFTYATDGSYDVSRKWTDPTAPCYQVEKRNNKGLLNGFEKSTFCSDGIPTSKQIYSVTYRNDSNGNPVSADAALTEYDSYSNTERPLRQWKFRYSWELLH